MDERLGRSAARNLGLKVVGLIGVLIEARKQGLITNAGEIMERLSNEAGFWISAELRKLVTG
jgi:predicted nucleic acid-binding protein